MRNGNKANEVHKMNNFTVVVYFALAAIVAFLIWLFCYFEYGKYMVNKHQSEWDELAETLSGERLYEEYIKFIDMLIKTRNGYLPRMTKKQRERYFLSQKKMSITDVHIP